MVVDHAVGCRTHNTGCDGDCDCRSFADLDATTPLTDAEEHEYWDDVWDCGIPMSHAAAVWLWEKWGKRLGLPKPERK